MFTCMKQHRAKEKCHSNCFGLRLLLILYFFSSIYHTGIIFHVKHHQFQRTKQSFYWLESDSDTADILIGILTGFSCSVPFWFCFVDCPRVCGIDIARHTATLQLKRAKFRYYKSTDRANDEKFWNSKISNTQCRISEWIRGHHYMYFYFMRHQ